MTLLEAKTMLERRQIPYETAQYENEAEYFCHLMPFPYLKNAESCQVIALVIPSVNGMKNIELEFLPKRGEYVFHELHFGGYCFEMYNHDADLLEADLIDLIGQVVDRKLGVIEVNDRRKKRWKSTLCFDLSDDDDVFGTRGFRETLEQIDSPKTFWQKLTGQCIQYDIYDWRNYRQVIK
jgi:hypothetical protein